MGLQEAVLPHCHTRPFIRLAYLGKHCIPQLVAEGGTRPSHPVPHNERSRRQRQHAADAGRSEAAGIRCERVHCKNKSRHRMRLIAALVLMLEGYSFHICQSGRPPAGVGLMALL